MGKLIVAICIEHPQVEKMVEEMEDVIGNEEFEELIGKSFRAGDSKYCPVIIFNEGDHTDTLLRNNNGIYGGHKYEIRKGFAFFKKKGMPPEKRC